MKHFGFVVISAIAFISFGANAETAAPAAGWIIAKNKPCKIWNPEPQPRESVTWSGACKGGFASGKGILRWTENGKPDAEFDGEYANGKRNGPGVLTMPDGQKAIGNWADDELVPEDKDAI
jgi:hypothetical protein